MHGTVVDLTDRSQEVDVECVEDPSGGLAAGEHEVDGAPALSDGSRDNPGQTVDEVAGRCG